MSIAGFEIDYDLYSKGYERPRSTEEKVPHIHNNCYFPFLSYHFFSFPFNAVLFFSFSLLFSFIYFLGIFSSFLNFTLQGSPGDKIYFLLLRQVTVIISVFCNLDALNIKERRFASPPKLKQNISSNVLKVLVLSTELIMQIGHRKYVSKAQKRF